MAKVIMVNVRQNDVQNGRLRASLTTLSRRVAKVLGITVLLCATLLIVSGCDPTLTPPDVARVGTIGAGFGVGEDTPSGLAASGNTLYMVGRTNGVLYTLDTTSGAATRVGMTEAGFGVDETGPAGLAASDGTLYMVGDHTVLLYTLDTTSGAATRVGMTEIGFGVDGNFGLGERIPSGLAASDGTLYMVGDATEFLYTLDITSGAATRVGMTEAGFGVGERIPTGLAAIGDILYMVGITGRFYTLDPTSGAATRVETIGAGFGVDENNPFGLAAIGNTLYMVGDENNALYVFVNR